MPSLTLPGTPDVPLKDALTLARASDSPCWSSGRTWWCEDDPDRRLIAEGQAVKACRKDCAHRAPCAAWGLTMDEVCVMGGFTEVARRKLRKTQPQLVAELEQIVLDMIAAARAKDRQRYVELNDQANAILARLDRAA